MALRMKKNSAFLAYQLAGSDSENSADERREEQKEKQKAKKKSRTKKKNSDSAVLKDLAMCAISKPKKSKGKAAKSTTTPPPEPADEAPASVPAAVAAPVVVVVEEKVPAPVPAARQPQPKAAAPVAKQVETKPKPSPAAAKTNAKATPAPQHAAKPQGTSAPPPPAAPNGVAAPPKQQQQQQQQQNGTDLGAIYSPTHVKITRADGQMTRTIAVSEMMDQLYLFGNQNAQLRIVQEQLTVANRSMQEQLQRDAEVINGLQNEVAMFRQMCLNLQAEVSLHRSATGTTKPSQPAAHRPPPGM